MNVSMTANELMDKGVWDEVCELRGLSVWCVNEGQMESDHEFVFTKEEAINLRLIPNYDDDD